MPIVIDEYLYKKLTRPNSVWRLNFSKDKDNPVLERRCAICKVWYPHTSEFFYKNYRKCKHCHKQIANRYNDRNKETPEFKERNRRGTLAWRNRNRERYNEYQKEWSRKNRIKQREEAVAGT